MWLANGRPSNTVTNTPNAYSSMNAASFSPSSSLKCLGTYMARNEFNVRADPRAAAMIDHGAMLPARRGGARCSASLYVSTPGDLGEYVHEPLGPNVGERDPINLVDMLPCLRGI